MTNPRSESVHRSRSGELGLARHPDIHGEAAYKVDRYAHLARYIDQGVDDLLRSDEFVGYIVNARSKEGLTRNFTHLLWRSVRSDEFQSVVAAHAEHGMGDIDLLVGGGIGTFVRTTEAVYDVIKTEHGSGAAALDGNVAVIDRLAKMDLEQFNPYADFYLHSFGRRDFLNHLDETPAGFRFKKDYPQDAFIPEAYRYYTFNTPYEDEREARSSPFMRIGDIRKSPATVGCPVTFNPERMPELWRLYAAARQNLERRHLGAGALTGAD